MDDLKLSQPIAKRPPKPYQVRKAYQKRGGKPRMSEIEKRRLDRELELDRRAAEIRAKEKRRRELEEKRKQKIDDERQRRKNLVQGEAPVQARSSQQTLPKFFDGKTKKFVTLPTGDNHRNDLAIPTSAQSTKLLMNETSKPKYQMHGQSIPVLKPKTFASNEQREPTVNPNYESQAVKQLEPSSELYNNYAENNLQSLETPQLQSVRLCDGTDLQNSYESAVKAKNEKMEGTNQLFNIQLNKDLVRHISEKPMATAEGLSPSICRQKESVILAPTPSVWREDNLNNLLDNTKPSLEPRSESKSNNWNFAIPAKLEKPIVTKDGLSKDCLNSGTFRFLNTLSSYGIASAEDTSLQSIPLPAISQTVFSHNSPRNCSLVTVSEGSGVTTVMSKGKFRSGLSPGLATGVLGEDTILREYGSPSPSAENSKLRIQFYHSKESHTMRRGSSANIGISYLVDQRAVSSGQIYGSLSTTLEHGGANHKETSARNNYATNATARRRPLQHVDDKPKECSVGLITGPSELNTIHNDLEDFLESNTQIQRDIERPIIGPSSPGTLCRQPASQTSELENNTATSLEFRNRISSSKSGFGATYNKEGLIDAELLDISTQELNDYDSSSPTLLSPDIELKPKSASEILKQNNIYQADNKSENPFDGGLSDDQWATIDPDALIGLR